MRHTYILDYELSSTYLLNRDILGSLLALNSDEIYNQFSSQNATKNQSDIVDYLTKRYSKKIERSVQLCLYSAERLLNKIKLSDEQKMNTGIFLGNNYAGWSYVEQQMVGLYHGDHEAINPYVATAWFPAAAQGELSIRNRLFGLSKTFSNDSLSGFFATDFAMLMLEEDKIEYALVGGHESLRTPIIDSGLKSEGITSDQYPASEAASHILITQNDHERERALAEISLIDQADTLDILLMKLQKNIESRYVGYCMLAPLNLQSEQGQKQICEEIKSIQSYLGKDLAIGMPTYFLGEICGASFTAQVCFACDILANQFIPRSYLTKTDLQHCSGVNIELVPSTLKSILVIGRDYHNCQYVSMLIKAI